MDICYSREAWQIREEQKISISSKQEFEWGHKPLFRKWVFKVKRDVDGAITRFKAYWVVRDYQQQFGIDFNEMFVAVVKLMAFEVLFTIIAYYNLDIN